MTGNVNVREIFQKYVDCPVYVDNDANVAALGEKHKGAGEGSDDVVAITLGTGLGGVSFQMEKLYMVTMDQELKSATCVQILINVLIVIVVKLVV